MTTCILRGPHAYAWLARLAPALDGRRTLAELTVALPDDKRAMVDRLVGSLVEQRFVVDARNEPAEGLTDAERRLYADEIAFIGYAFDSPEKRFLQARQSRVTLSGEGPLLRAVLTAFLGFGCRDLRVVTADPAGLATLISREHRDPGQRVRVESLDTGSSDLLVQIGDDIGELVRTSRECHRSGTPVAQVLVRPSEVWVSEVGPPAVTQAESGWHRLAAAPVEPRLRAEENWLTGPVPSVVAAVLGLACFSFLTGMERPLEDGTPRLTRIDLRNLDTRSHRFLPHPRAITTAPAPDGGVTPVNAEQVLERVPDLVDPWLGALTSLDEGDLAQSPLAVCRARVSDPLSVLPHWVPLPEVAGWGEDRQTARFRAMLAAAAVYGGLTTQEGVYEGVELLTGRIRPISLDQEPAPVGVGAGLSWDQAVAAGLRAHCEHLLQEGVDGGDSGTLAGPDGDHARISAGLDGGHPAVELPDSHLGRMIGLAGLDVDVRDLTDVLGVPAFGFRLAGHGVVVSCAPTPYQAMHDGLERVLLRWQNPVYGQEPPRWLDGPPDTALLAHALRRQGRVPVAVRLAGDPAAARMLPCAVRVVLL
ncbi:hypothetical protein [Nonomuraea turkmeniaca]|uniref:hypothetical protein n=1 Tax=Nonomuraea turkmeniaca TaxID=103838 RepID=UPI0014776DD5|nr:hypothetical protein [Nonomuraea turkmeniaca]